VGLNGSPGEGEEVRMLGEGTPTQATKRNARIQVRTCMREDCFSFERIAHSNPGLLTGGVCPARSYFDGSDPAEKHRRDSPTPSPSHIMLQAMRALASSPCLPPRNPSPTDASQATHVPGAVRAAVHSLGDIAVLARPFLLPHRLPSPPRGGAIPIT